jgi:hypothetical protein
VVGLLRVIARLVALLLLIALALLGLATAIFAIQGDSATLSLPTLARHFQLPRLRPVVGDWLAQLGASGPTALVSLGGGLAAIATGLLLLVGIFVSPRERLVLYEEDERGLLTARPRTLSQIATALAESIRGVTVTRARVRSRRRGRGGKLQLRATHVASIPNDEAESAITQALSPFAESFELKPYVSTKVGKPRVQ